MDSNFGVEYAIFRKQVYSKWQCVTNQGGKLNTINIEFCRIGASGPNFNDKQLMQVSQIELPIVLAVLQGVHDRTDKFFHGDNVRYFQLGWDSSDKYGRQLKITMKGHLGELFVYLSDSDRFYCSAIVTQQLCKNLRLSERGVLALIESTFKK